MKLIKSENNVYVFRSYLLISNIIIIFLMFMCFKLYFYDNDMKNALICILISLFIAYIFIVYCKIIFDFNQGIVYCIYLKFFKIKKFNFDINTIEKITNNVILTKNGSGRAYLTSLTIYTTSSESNIITFDLATNKDQLHQSVVLMNSLLEQYKQKQGANSEIAKSPCSKP